MVRFVWHQLGPFVGWFTGVALEDTQLPKQQFKTLKPVVSIYRLEYRYVDLRRGLTPKFGVIGIS